MRRQFSWVVIAVLTLTCLLGAQSKLEHRNLVLNGHSGDITIFMVDGKPFVNLKTLVDIGNGSYAFNGDTILLTFSSATPAPTCPQAAGTPAPAPAPVAEPQVNEASSHALSPDFMSAAVQELGILKDWRAYMAYGITKGVPGDGSRMVLAQNKAIEGLNHAQITASNESDRSALQLLKNDFDNVNQWYKTLVEGRKNMTTANYSMSEDPLKTDSQYQKIVKCSDFLGSMIPSGTFSDDGSCQ